MVNSKSNCDIYKTTQQNISLHIKSIYQERELQESSTYKKFLLIQKEGNREVKRNVETIARKL